MPDTIGLMGLGEFKSVTLESYQQVFGTGGEWQTDAMSVAMAYRRVPWYRRAADLRANAVGDMPRTLLVGGKDILAEVETAETTDGAEQADQPKPAKATLPDPAADQLQKFLKQQRRIYHLAELSLFKYGCAYFLPESNRYGFNTRLRHVPSPCVRPIVDSMAGVVGFTVTTNTGARDFDLKEIIHIWLPNDESETEPGAAPGLAALESAGLLHYLDRFASMYFKGGAVPVTAVIVPANTQQKEVERVENFFNRMAAGIRNAFKYVAMRAGSDVKQLGANIKDTRAPEMTTEQRDNVAVAAGVPPTVIDGKAANYATANSEWFGFFLTTIIPQCTLIDEVLNDQYFARLDAEVVSQPEKLEIMQAAQLEQAAAVMELTGGKAILTVDEGRELIGRKPNPELNQPEPAPVIVGPDGQPVPPKPGQPAQQPAQPVDTSVDEDDEDEDDEERRMKAWREAALANVGSAVGCPFDAQLLNCHSKREVRGVFKQHWPKPAKATADDVVRELRLARQVLERAHAS
jgi:HK97 family phage portal protein